jgi:hypothetical protein
MDTFRKTALVAGVLYLVTFISSIPAVFLLEPVLSNPNYVASAGADSRVSLGAFLDLVNALACIATALALFSVVKRQHEGLALGFVATRMFEAAVIMIGVISVLAVVTLRQVGVAEGAAAALVPAGRALVAVRDWTFVLGPGTAGLNALMIGTLMYRSRLVPRAIPALGLIGAPVFYSAVLGTVLGITQFGSAWYVIGGLFMFAWELLFGLWMTFKGFNRSSPLIAAAAAETGSLGASAMTHTQSATVAKAGAA